MSFFQSFFSISQYKPKQGVLIRRLCQLASSLCGVGLGVSVAHFTSEGGGVGLFVAVLLAALWLSWRIVQYPPVSDFLIDVQSESRRVSWSRVVDVKRSTLVVLFVMFLLSLYLFLCDIVLQFVLRSAFVLNF